MRGEYCRKHTWKKLTEWRLVFTSPSRRRRLGGLVDSASYSAKRLSWFDRFCWLNFWYRDVSILW